MWKKQYGDPWISVGQVRKVCDLMSDARMTIGGFKRVCGGHSSCVVQERYRLAKGIWLLEAEVLDSATAVCNPEGRGVGVARGEREWRGG